MYVHYRHCETFPNECSIHAATTIYNTHSYKGQVTQTSGSSLCHLITNYRSHCSPRHFCSEQTLWLGCFTISCGCNSPLACFFSVSCLHWWCCVTLSQSSEACAGVNRWSRLWWLVSDLSQIGIRWDFQAPQRWDDWNHLKYV